jgi:hypothetical protein
MDKDIVIIHHHLLTGGVTKVIETQCNSLKAQGITPRIIVGDDGGRQPGGIKPVVVPELNYLEKHGDSNLHRQQLQELGQALKEHLNSNSILHVHNLNLGKNPLLNVLMDRLSKEGYRIINHCHDFAEDQRPQNMEHLESVISGSLTLELSSILYPKECPYEYIVINGPDLEFLEKQGVSVDRITHLGNAIDVPSPKDPEACISEIHQQLSLLEKLPIVLYPVRAIARKNIGEFILLASLFEGRFHFMITQPPKNPKEIPEYENWKSFCQEESIPVIFEAGVECDFESLMSAADRIISTSINEGFGMGFLEPWLWGKPVIGRDLPKVSNDFKKMGLKFSGLYDELEIDCLDFSLFSPDNQKSFIQATRKKKELIPDIIRDFELEPLFSKSMDDDLKHNRDLILTHYSPESYGQTLRGLYETSL